MQRSAIPIYGASELREAYARAIADARERFAAIAAIPLAEVSPASVLDAWDGISIEIEDVIGPVAILNSVHPDRDVRDAGDDVLLELSSFTTELFQNQALYERVRAVVPQTPPEEQFRRDLLESFEDAGVSLPAERRARVREINDEMTALSQEFARHIRENNTRLRFTPEECEGLPRPYVERAAKDPQGNLLVGFDQPDYGPFMMNARDGKARQRYYVAYFSRGTRRNLEILDRIVSLRRELARLYDLPSYAHFVTRRRMVGSPEVVRRFLDEVSSAVSAAEQRDLDALRALKAELTGVATEAAKVERWDVQFYSERLRERRFAIDQEELRRHFPTLPTVEWLLRLTERLYGIRFEQARVPVWHEDVIAHEVFDAASGAYVGAVYLDLFPRAGKYKHAAAWPVRGVSTKAGRTPVSVLVTNFDRIGLTHTELETLLHEFGHVLHGVLSETVYNHHSGTSVQRDFVEAPSQMYEEWARRFESLRTIKDVIRDGPGVDEALAKRLDEARRFGQGIRYARQHLYASFDMALAGENPGPALEVWKRMEGSGPMGYVPGTAFPGTFGHIAEGYAAGYYGYMWAEVLALDMLSAFGDDLMNPEIGMRFRKTVLARGGEAPAMQIVEQFLGRPVSSEAFFREITGSRE